MLFRSAQANRLPTDQVRTLQGKLALDPAPAEKKAYHELYLTYVLASRTAKTDARTSKALVEQGLKAFEASKDPEIQALVGGLIGLKIGFSPMSGITQGPRAVKLFDEALAQRPGNPRIAVLRAVHLLNTPAFVGGGIKVALPLMEEAVRFAEKEAPSADPWAPSWGRLETLGWLAYAQVEAGQADAARATVDKVMALDPGNGFVTAMVLPKLKGGAK